MSIFTAAQDQLLKTELLTDPAGLGYAGKTNNQAANLLNSATATTGNPLGPYPLHQVIAQIDQGEYDAACSTQALRDKLALYLRGNFVDLSAANVKTAMRQIFTQPLAPLTRAAINNLINPPLTRVEVVIARGFVVAKNDVERALAS